MTITVAVDGSSLGNPGATGWCWFANESCWEAGGWEVGTNNQGELTALLKLLQATADSEEDLLVLADSQYVINIMTKWRFGWKAKGWKRGKGQPIENLDIIKALDEAIAGRSVRFEWVRGHAGHPLNEAADSRARGYATAVQSGSVTEALSGPGFAHEKVVAVDSIAEVPIESAARKRGIPSNPNVDDNAIDTLFDSNTQIDSKQLDDLVAKVQRLINIGCNPGQAVDTVAEWFGTDHEVLRTECRQRIRL